MSHLVVGPPLSRVRHHVPGAVAAAIATGLLLALSAAWPGNGLVIAVALLQLALVLSWSLALGLRGYLGAALIGLGTAAAADVVLLRTNEPGLGPLAAVVALAFIVALVHQLLRRPPRQDLTDSLAGVALQIAAVVGLSAYVALNRIATGTLLLDACVAAVGAAVVVGHLVDLALPYPRIVDGVPRGLLGFLAGTALAMYVAVVQGEANDLVARLGAVILGGILGAVACLIAIAASYAAAERRGRGPAQAALQALLPFAATAPIAYFLSVVVT